ncbi:MAG: hypothetical protein WCW56_00305 [Candidatus Paceibacterota bacterium]|jgi:hypothetical protein
MDIQTDLSQLGDLLAAGKKDEATALIDAYINQDLSDEEKGTAYVAWAKAYMDASNTIDQSYSEALKGWLETLREIDKESDETVKEAKVASLKNEIKNFGA